VPRIPCELDLKDYGSKYFVTGSGELICLPHVVYEDSFPARDSLIIMLSAPCRNPYRFRFSVTICGTPLPTDKENNRRIQHHCM